MTTRTYRLDHDLGFAPNPFFGWCTLACCMPLIRKHAAQGDIIIGMAGAGRRGLGRIFPQLIYWMRVDEALSFDDYWRDARFHEKRPQIPGPKLRMVGDRTYRHYAGEHEWRFDRSMHHIPGKGSSGGSHVHLDTSVDRLLVGQSFTYWGGAGPPLPAHLLGLFPNPRGQRCPPPGPLLDELHALIGLDAPRGVVGDPADWMNQRYFC